MKILVLGSKGQIGRCLADQSKSNVNETVLTTRTELDMTDFSQVKGKISEAKPCVVINAAAYTDVDKAESEEELAHLVNHHAVSNLAKICAELNCGLIHISTDYVFDGGEVIPYLETDTTNPQGVYGDSKLLGEMAIEASDCEYMIIRTAWVFSEYGKNFLKTMLRLGATNEHLNIVGDQIGCPTYAQDVARFILCVSDHFQDPDFESGIVHFCGDNPVSWYQFAVEIFESCSELGLRAPKSLNCISTGDYPTLAIRPAYSVMDCQKGYQNFGMPPSDWRKAIPHVLNKLR